MDLDVTAVTNLIENYLMDKKFLPHNYANIWEQQPRVVVFLAEPHDVMAEVILSLLLPGQRRPPACPKMDQTSQAFPKIL